MKGKPKRFEKVIEWEKYPDNMVIFMGIWFILGSTIILCVTYIVDGFSSLNEAMLVTFCFSFMHFIGWVMLWYGLGKGKQVYWKEMKDEK